MARLVVIVIIGILFYFLGQSIRCLAGTLRNVAGFNRQICGLWQPPLVIVWGDLVSFGNMGLGSGFWLF